MSHLPAFKHKEEILSTVLSNRITIVTGETGSGKSTQIPQYILDHHISQGSHPRIICTQPRRISAISLSQFVAKSRDLPQNTNQITYQIGGDRANVHPTQTNLIYATTGILKEQILRDLRNERAHDLNYDYIIMDEVHERTVDVDVVLLLMKRLLRKYPNLRLVLMSATINANHFAKYYQIEEDLCGGKVPIVNIPVRCFEVKEYYLEDILKLLHIPARVIQIDKPSSERRVLEVGVKLIQHLDREERDLTKSILVFLPGLASIMEMTNMLDDLGFYVLPAHSTVPTDEQKRIFAPAPQGMRKVVISTNIAESSITVPDVSVVIDFCLEKQLQLNPITNCQSLNEVFSAKESCEQRKGRAGRTGPGTCYRVLTREQYQSLPDHSSPEIQRTHISRLMLQILRMDVGTPEEILTGCLDPPHESLIASSYSELFTFEAITLNEETNMVEITNLGLLLSDLPLDVRIGIFLLNCFALGLEYEGVVVASIISLDISPIYHNPSDPVGNVQRKFQYMRGTCSDILAAFNAYETYQRLLHVEHSNSHHSRVTRVARDMNLNVKKLNEIYSQVKIIYQRLPQFGVYMPAQEERCRTYQTTKDVHPLTLRLLILLICATFIDNAFVATLSGKVKDTRPQLKLRGLKKENANQLSAYLRRWLGRNVRATLTNSTVTFDEQTAPELLNSAMEMLRVNPKALKKIRMSESQRRQDVGFLDIYSEALYEPNHKLKPLFRTKYSMRPVSSSVCFPIVSRTFQANSPVYFVPTQVRGKNDDPKLFASYITRLPEEPGLLDLLLLLFSKHVHCIFDEDQLPIFGVTHHSTTHHFKAALTDELVTLINFVRSHLQTFPENFMNRQSSRERNLKVVNMFLLLTDMYTKNYDHESRHLLTGGLYSEDELQDFHARAHEIHDVFVQESQIASASGVVRKNCPCREMVVTFLDNPDEKLLSFPPSLSKADRRVLHVVCDSVGLNHESKGKGTNRYLTIVKPPNFSLANNKMKIKNTYAMTLEEGDARRLTKCQKLKTARQVVPLSAPMKSGLSQSFYDQTIVEYSEHKPNYVAYVQICDDELGDADTFSLSNGLAASIWQLYSEMTGANVLTLCCVEQDHPSDTLLTLQALMIKVYEPHHYYWFKPDDVDVRDSEILALQAYADSEQTFLQWYQHADSYRFVLQDHKDFYTINLNTPDHQPYSIVFNGTMTPFADVAGRILNQEIDALGNMVCRVLLLNPKSKVENCVREFESMSVIDSCFSILEDPQIPMLNEELAPEWDLFQQKIEDQVRQYHYQMAKGSIREAINAFKKACYQVGHELSGLEHDKRMLFHMVWYLCLMALPIFPSLQLSWSENFGAKLQWSHGTKTLSWNIFDVAHVTEQCEGMELNKFFDEFTQRLHKCIDGKY